MLLFNFQLQFQIFFNSEGLSTGTSVIQEESIRKVEFKKANGAQISLRLDRNFNISPTQVECDSYLFV